MNRVYGVNCWIYGDSPLLVIIKCNFYLGFFFLHFLGNLVEFLICLVILGHTILIAVFAIVTHALNRALAHGPKCQTKWVLCVNLSGWLFLACMM